MNKEFKPDYEKSYFDALKKYVALQKKIPDIKFKAWIWGFITGYTTAAIGGSIRQRSWRGLAFHGDGTVKYLHNGAIVARNMSFEGMAILIRLLGREKI